MLGNFPACDAFTAGAEGGLSMDPTDPGNWTGGQIGAGLLRGTKYGISAAAHPTLAIAALTPAGAAEIRRMGYWVPIAGDVLPLGVDLMAYDFSVNAGPGTSARELQAVVGVAQDGAIGPVTLAAVRAADPAALIGALAGAHLAHYAGLANFPRDGNGWDARVQRCRAAAMGMVDRG